MATSGNAKKLISDIVESPFVMAPIIGAAFGLFFSIPVLVGMSDRAAYFAGGLLSALAAVIAVILTAEFNRRNDNERELRAIEAELKSLKLELDIFFQLSLRSAATLKKNFDAKFSNYENDKDRYTNATCRYVFNVAFPRLNDRVISKLGMFARPVAVQLAEYDLVQSATNIIFESALRDAEKQAPKELISAVLSSINRLMEICGEARSALTSPL